MPSTHGVASNVPWLWALAAVFSSLTRCLCTASLGKPGSPLQKHSLPQPSPGAPPHSSVGTPPSALGLGNRSLGAGPRGSLPWRRALGIRLLHRGILPLVRRTSAAASPPGEDARRASSLSLSVQPQDSSLALGSGRKPRTGRRLLSLCTGHRARSARGLLPHGSMLACPSATGRPDHPSALGIGPQTLGAGPWAAWAHAPQTLCLGTGPQPSHCIIDATSSTRAGHRRTKRRQGLCTLDRHGSLWACKVTSCTVQPPSKYDDTA